MSDTYEVRIKDDQTPMGTQPAGLTDDQISSLIDQRSTEKADEIATSKVERLKEELAQSLSGKQESRYGDRGPESWEKFQDDTTERAVRIAEKKIEERLAAEKKKQEELSQKSQEEIKKAQEAEFARISAEWTEAVNDGILPDISSEVKSKLKSGVSYEDLTEEERNDKGLKAYNEARMLHIKLKSEGKSNSFYRTATQFYNRAPAGTRAPVIGGTISSPGSSEESDLSYDEIAKNRKEKFGF